MICASRRSILAANTIALDAGVPRSAVRSVLASVKPGEPGSSATAADRLLQLVARRVAPASSGGSDDDDDDDDKKDKDDDDNDETPEEEKDRKAVERKSKAWQKKYAKKKSKTKTKKAAARAFFSGDSLDRIEARLDRVETAKLRAAVALDPSLEAVLASATIGLDPESAAAQREKIITTAVTRGRSTSVSTGDDGDAFESIYAMASAGLPLAQREEIRRRMLAASPGHRSHRHRSSKGAEVDAGELAKIETMMVAGMTPAHADAARADFRRRIGRLH